jgi:Flp pilus assembly protein TadD
LGIIKLKQYEDAVIHLTKVIDGKAFKDDRPEYNRGLSYERLGEMELSKAEYRRSKSLGYPLAQKLPESKLK